MDVKLQMGGSDQWGNIVTGTELIRRKDSGEAFALTAPLVKKADGSKFGKSEGENIWLDPERTTPYKFYQYWLNSSDEDASNYIRIFTLFDKEKIEALEKEHQVAPHLRILQKTLADELTLNIHSKQDLEMAKKASGILFGRSTTDELNEIDEKTLLSVFDGVPQSVISKNEYKSAEDITSLLSATTKGIIFPSKGEARRMIKGGGVSVNKEKIIDPDQKVNFSLLNDKYLLVQKGKKNYYLVIVQ
jgi:tyrosyl-tRNA synthetase